jgi:hypothetical protein
VTAKNSMKVNSPCFGKAAVLVAETGGEIAVGLIAISTWGALTGVTAGADGEHAVANMISIKRKGRDFRDMGKYQ